MDYHKVEVISEGHTITTTNTSIVESFESVGLTYKVICVGDSRIGKTAFIQRCVQNRYDDHYKSTIGVDFATKKVTIDNTKCGLTLWDLSGQEIYGHMLRVYFKKSLGALIFCSAASINSLRQVDKWLKELDTKLGNETMPKYLIITKLDIVYDHLNKYFMHYKLLTSHIRKDKLIKYYSVDSVITAFDELLEQKKHLFTKIFKVSAKNPKLNAPHIDDIMNQLMRDIANSLV